MKLAINRFASRGMMIQYMKLGFVFIFLMILCSCSNDKEDIVAEEIFEEQVDTDDPVEEEEEPVEEVEEEETSFVLPEIDLNNWKVTLPISENGKPIEVEPLEILGYAQNEVLKPFMYNDSINGALVFHTYPGATTTNSSYSRTELREQMDPGSNSTNWTFVEGGRMKGTLSVPFISKDSNNEYHRTIVMQIHGRLTNEQRDRIGENDNNAPPILKIYWQKGKVRILTKKLKDLDTSGDAILSTDAWGDDDGFTFDEEVDDNTFSLEVIVSDSRLEVVLNDNESKVYDDINMQKWGVFENYFKAGNYLQTVDEGSSATVKYYSLEVTH